MMCLVSGDIQLISFYQNFDSQKTKNDASHYDKISWMEFFFQNL